MEPGGIVLEGLDDFKIWQGAPICNHFAGLQMRLTEMQYVKPRPEARNTLIIQSRVSTGMKVSALEVSALEAILPPSLELVERNSRETPRAS